MLSRSELIAQARAGIANQKAYVIKIGGNVISSGIMQAVVDQIEADTETIERLETAIRNRIHWIDGEDHCDCGECGALFSALKGD